ncbi:hypothetical protein [Streptomyces sp. DSM 15324]|uniref:hypothetical protein n=1 Tax=Streptomyces sp. DSM 15324 TaxID=1739111 RepID=UPI001F25EB10|nr:hypothetical protein [Streptomyces sp. DSM 15324]
MTKTRRALLALLGPLSLVLLGVPSLQGTASAAAPPPGQVARYTMTAFTNSSESNLYVYDSPDATAFTLRKGPAYTPPSGLIRDPSVFQHTDGFYYLTYTTNWTGNTIGFAHSTDPPSFTEDRDVGGPARERLLRAGPPTRCQPAAGTDARGGSGTAPGTGVCCGPGPGVTAEAAGAGV